MKEVHAEVQSLSCVISIPTRNIDEERWMGGLWLDSSDQLGQKEIVGKKKLLIFVCLLAFIFIPL